MTTKMSLTFQSEKNAEWGIYPGSAEENNSLL